MTLHVTVQREDSKDSTMDGLVLAIVSRLAPLTSALEGNLDAPDAILSTLKVQFPDHEVEYGDGDPEKVIKYAYCPATMKFKRILCNRAVIHVDEEGVPKDVLVDVAASKTFPLVAPQDDGVHLGEADGPVHFGPDDSDPSGQPSGPGDVVGALG